MLLNRRKTHDFIKSHPLQYKTIIHRHAILTKNVIINNSDTFRSYQLSVSGDDNSTYDIFLIISVAVYATVCTILVGQTSGKRYMNCHTGLWHSIMRLDYLLMTEYSRHRCEELYSPVYLINLTRWSLLTPSR